VTAHALFDVVGRPFDHHDGVVNHDADGEDDGEQGGEVDREPQRRHGGKRPDDGDRNRRGGHQHGPPILQEGEDDHEHQDRRLIEGLIDLADRLLDELGGVERDVITEPLREFGRQRRHFSADLIADLERVRAGRLEDREPGGRPAIEPEVLAVGLGAEFDAADVAYSCDAAVRGGLDDHVREAVGLAQSAHHVEGVLEGLSVGRWRHADLAGRDLLALLLQRPDDVLHVEPARLHLVGVEPDPHRILSGAEHRDIADAGQPGDFILQPDGAEVAHVQAVVAGIGRRQRDDLQDRGRPLLHVDALHLDGLGQ
jgi:hypothetical protein